jgi:methionine sulfoxide reductase heme-binding subunit
MLRIVLNNRWFLWALMALPGVSMMLGFLGGKVDAEELLHPTGEFSARFMIIAMIIAPLIDLFGPRAWLRWMMARRRYFGLAAFGYAVLHLVLYVIDMGALEGMLAEALAPGIWTGWAALALFVPLAITSNDASMRALKAGWKRVQRLVYPAAVLTLLHWIWVHNNLVPALVHFVPLAGLIIARFALSSSRKPQGV